MQPLHDDDDSRALGRVEPRRHRLRERTHRFQRFLRLLPTARASLAVLASEAGYADQAHLAREVRRLSGQSPSGLMAELRS